MIICPNCNHSNPQGATQCEACYTPLPETTSCPNCGATVQMDATFCGQCGFSLKPEMMSSVDEVETIVDQTQFSADGSLGAAMFEDEPTIQSIPSNSIDPMVSRMKKTELSNPPDISMLVMPESEEINPSFESITPSSEPPISLESLNWSPPPSVSSTPSTPPAPPKPSASSPLVSASGNSPTQLQVQTASLFHVQTKTKIELPQYLSVIHIGKPNDQIPPDIDVSGFANSEIVSRIHADIRVEGDSFYIEDVGSSNGTYINHTPLLPGNRHRLRPGDSVALGKGDKVTFIFQLS